MLLLPRQEDGDLSRLGRALKECIQCGTCTASCANAAAMVRPPRQSWRLLQLGLLEEVLASSSFAVCSSCYLCTLRCPRGLPLTETMHALKRLAAARRAQLRGVIFARNFVNTVRRHGRVREMVLMRRYFLGARNPLLALGFLPLGWRLLRKGRLRPAGIGLGGQDKLEALFQTVAELEAES